MGCRFGVLLGALWPHSSHLLLHTSFWPGGWGWEDNSYLLAARFQCWLCSPPECGNGMDRIVFKDLEVKEIWRVKRPKARDHLLFYAVTPGHFADLGLSLLFHQKMGWIEPSQILPSPGMEFLVCRKPGWVIHIHFYLSTTLYLMSFS